MRGQLLDRDPALAERSGCDHVQAAPARLGGERARKGDDRPQTGDEREEWAVLPRQRPAQRLDVDRIVVQALERIGDVVDHVLEVQARCRRGVGGGERLAAGDHDAGQQPGHDDEGQTRVAERLGVDAAEAVQAAPQRCRCDPPAERGTAGFNGHHFASPAGASPAGASSVTRPYWARNVSSRLGSRLRKSVTPRRAAAWTSGVIGPSTRNRSR